MADFCFLCGFIAFATGWWWLAPWLCLVLCGVLLMVIAGLMHVMSDNKGERKKGVT